MYAPGTAVIERHNQRRNDGTRGLSRGIVGGRRDMGGGIGASRPLTLRSRLFSIDSVSAARCSLST